MKLGYQAREAPSEPTGLLLIDGQEQLGWPSGFEDHKEPLEENMEIRVTNLTFASRDELEADITIYHISGLCVSRAC